MLCVTEGSIDVLADNLLAVSVPNMRAVVVNRTQQIIEARVTYLGRTEPTARLRSGAMREQFGFKLRAQDGCNVIYAMWRIAPSQSISVSVKHNPDMHTSRECRNAGYHNVRPRRMSYVSPLRAGEQRTLRAELTGSELTILIDGTEVWNGDVGSSTLRLDGPVGLRSDNARLKMEAFAALNDETPRSSSTNCRVWNEHED